MGQNLVAQTSPENKFLKIDSEHYELIFPESFSKKANAIAGILDTSYEHINQSLGVPKDYKLSIIFNNRTAFTNGFVTLAPFYSVFYTLPPQTNTYTLFYDDWIKMLASHELRHAAQFNKLNYGFNRVLYYIFGDPGLGIGMGLSAPGWFFEGDAVYTETALTNFGRGRTASFSMLTRSMLLSGEIPEYSQAYLNSDYKVYPNIYELGYLINAYLRNKYGADIFDKILTFSSTWDILTGPYSFPVAVFNKTGKSLFINYDELMSFLSSYWKTQLEKISLTGYEVMSNKYKLYYTSYSYPVKSVGDENIYAYKSGKFNSGAIVKISPNYKEQVITFTGNLTGNLNIGKKTLVWSEEEPDLRWSESTSVIVMYEMDSGKIKKIKLNGHLYSPSISGDEKNIACIENDISGDSYLVILNKETSTIIEKVETPAGAIWQTPRWGHSVDKIAILESTSKGKAIVIYDLSKNKIERKMNPVKHQISDPFIFNDHVLFHMDSSGIDNIHALNINSGEMKQITSVTLGAFHPFVSADGKYLYFSSFTRMGYEIAQMKYDPSLWTNEQAESAVNPFTNTDPSRTDYKEGIFDNIPDKQFKITPYSDFLNFLDFHSRYISPVTDSSKNSKTALSFSGIKVAFVSSNKLQTHFIDVGYTYRVNQNIHSVNAQWIYQGWFPIITVAGSYDFPTSTNTASSLPVLYQRMANLDVLFPFNISRGPFTHTIQTGVDTGYSMENNYSGFKADTFLNYDFTLAGNPRLFDNPYFRFGIHGMYAPQVSVVNQSRSFRSASTYLEIPGFLNNNKLLIQAGGSQRDNTFDPLSTPGILPRGIVLPSYSKFYLFSVDYSLPLFYPDLNIFHVIYLRKFSLNLFYERVWVQPIAIENSQYVGTDFLVTFNLFDLASNIIAGVRFIYLPTTKKLFAEPLLQLAINVKF